MTYISIIYHISVLETLIRLFSQLDRYWPKESLTTNELTSQPGDYSSKQNETIHVVRLERGKGALIKVWLQAAATCMLHCDHNSCCIHVCFRYPDQIQLISIYDGDLIQSHAHFLLLAHSCYISNLCHLSHQSELGHSHHVA